jgi:D-sedoheptulose 7-phosphate isomerase
VAEDLDLLRATVADTIALYEVTLRNPVPVLDAANAIVASLKAGGKLLLFGNGGSAADAQHVACELVSRFTRERQALAAIALTTDTSFLTATGNDYTFDRVFVRQIEALGRQGDVAFGITTSGRSPNVVDALKTARGLGLKTVALTARDGGPAGAAAEIHINVPTPSTPRAQEVHMTLLHFICDVVERAFVAGGAQHG